MTCWGVGSLWHWVSAMNSGPSSRMIIDSAPTGCSPSRARIWRTYCRCQLYCPNVPQIRLSASARCTITAPMAVVLVRMIARAMSG